MATLKDKLNLYSGNSKTAIQNSTRVPEHKTKSRDLVFGKFNFRYHSPGFYIYSQLHADPVFGDVQLSSCLPCPFSDILKLSHTLSDEIVCPDEILFLDTETTGLNRSGATIAFLIGMARIINNKIFTELLFIQNPIGEIAALDHLEALFKKYRYLVSYNGKSFDMPILKNRMILNRKKGLRISHHFDLLHIFRKLFVKGTVTSWSQQEMEKLMLNYHRTDDLPGSEIPQIYFDYVKYEHDGGLERIFLHNERDILCLAILFMQAIRTYSNRQFSKNRVQSGIARILLKNNEDAEAIKMLTMATSENIQTDSVFYRDRILLATLFRRQNKLEHAIKIYKSLIDDFECPWSHMALAKIYEHKLKDFELAQKHTQYLLSFYKENNQFPIPVATGGIFSMAGLQHRLERIQRKSKSQDAKL